MVTMRVPRSIFWSASVWHRPRHDGFPPGITEPPGDLLEAAAVAHVPGRGFSFRLGLGSKARGAKGWRLPTPNMGSPHGPVLVGARQNIAFSARDAAALGARITVGRVGLMHGLASGFCLPALWQNRTFSSRPRATASRPRVP